MFLHSFIAPALLYHCAPWGSYATQAVVLMKCLFSLEACSITKMPNHATICRLIKVVTNAARNLIYENWRDEDSKLDGLLSTKGTFVLQKAAILDEWNSVWKEVVPGEGRFQVWFVIRVWDLMTVRLWWEHPCWFRHRRQRWMWMWQSWRFWGSLREWWG